MKPCVYILESLKDGKRYIGSTNDLTRRLAQHNAGNVSSTKHRRPFILKNSIEYESLVKARVMESKFKKSKGLLDSVLNHGT